MAAKGKVLLIDDDQDFVDMNKAVLEKDGYEVAVAYNGEQGMEKARNEAPQVIVLDVMMATRSEGFNVARELRSSPVTRGIPILLVTAINDTVPFKFEPDETWLPVEDVIEKPVPPERLLSLVEERIGQVAKD